MRELRRRFIVNTPLGPALVWAISAADTVELGMIFHTFQLETKEPWNWSNQDVRIAGSTSARRADWASLIHLSEERVAFLMPAIRRHTQSQFYWKV